MLILINILFTLLFWLFGIVLIIFESKILLIVSDLIVDVKGVVLAFKWIEVVKEGNVEGSIGKVVWVLLTIVEGIIIQFPLSNL